MIIKIRNIIKIYGLKKLFKWWLTCI
jgi:hypothetical protein